MQQEQIIEIAGIEREARELEQNLILVDNQISELKNFEETLSELIDSKEDSLLASIGGRVYIKTKIEDKKNLFVEVGSGVVVKKTPEETLNIVINQVERLKDARMQIGAQLEMNQRKLEEFIGLIQNN